MYSTAQTLKDLGLAFATDIHLDHAKPSQLAAFIAQTSKMVEAGLLPVVTGDITNYAQMLIHIPILEAMGVKFVLGNHDIWGATFEDARARARGLAPTGYLSDLPYVEVSDKVALVGVDGFFDMRLGKLSPAFQTWDLEYNLSIKQPVMQLSIDACRAYARKDADALEVKFDALPEKFETVVVATHVPPFEEVSRYRGKPSEEKALPYYTNVTLGETLLKLAAKHSSRHLVVLAGHTHDPASHFILPNLHCIVGEATYGHPAYVA